MGIGWLVPLLQSGNAHSTGVVMFFLGSNAFLTGLQWLWAYKILVAVLALVFPSTNDTTDSVVDKKKD